MSLSGIDAEKLFKLGFKRPVSADRVYPQDIYEYKNTTWVIGGRIVPETTLLCEEEVYSQGIWVPSTDDLITWLEDTNCKFIISYDNSIYRIEVVTNENHKFKEKGYSVEWSLFKVICKILKAFGGPPMQKEYKVIEVDLIEKEEL